MTNPILPPLFFGADPKDNTKADDETKLTVDDANMDEGESTDDQQAVERDVAEADKVNDHLDAPSE
jgi:hypothetical protein